MKRLLSAVLVLLVGIVPVAAVANQERVPVEHLLWDIPFGIGVEECLALVKERAGIDLVEAFDIGWGNEYSAFEEQGFTWFSYPAKLTAHFDDAKDQFIGFSIQIWNGEKWRNYIPSGNNEALLKEDFARSFSEVWEIYQKTGDLFGAPTGGMLSLANPLKNVAHYYPYPMKNGVTDKAFLEEFFAGIDENYTTALLFTWYDNVKVMVMMGNNRIASWGISKPISISVQYAAKEMADEEKAYTFNHEK